MEDLILFCTACHKSFVFTGDEQREFSERGQENPRRCTKCRKTKKNRCYDPYDGWKITMGCSHALKKRRQRVHYSGPIWAGGLCN